VFALGAGAFLSFLLSAGCCFLSAGGVLGAGFSVFISGAVAAGAGFREEGPFLSGFGAGGSFAAGGWAAAAGSFTAGASVFGACGARGFTSAGGLFSDCFLLGDCSWAGSWAITAPASASEATISKLVNLFILLSVLVVNGGDLFNARRFVCPQCFAQRCTRAPPGASIAKRIQFVPTHAFGSPAQARLSFDTKHRFSRPLHCEASEM